MHINKPNLYRDWLQPRRSRVTLGLFRFRKFFHLQKSCLSGGWLVVLWSLFELLRDMEERFNWNPLHRHYPWSTILAALSCNSAPSSLPFYLITNLKLVNLAHHLWSLCVVFFVFLLLLSATSPRVCTLNSAGFCFGSSAFFIMLWPPGFYFNGALVFRSFRNVSPLKHCDYGFGHRWQDSQKQLCGSGIHLDCPVPPEGLQVMAIHRLEGEKLGRG